MKRVTRRQFLGGTAAGIAGAAVSAHVGRRRAAAAPPPDTLRAD